MSKVLCVVSLLACAVMVVANVEPQSPVLWNLSRSHGLHVFDLFPMVLAATAFGLAVVRPRLQPAHARR